MVAERAVERRAELCFPARGRGDPWAELPRRVVADVLGVAAGQVCDPVAELVLVKCDDRLLHGCGGFLPSRILA